MLPALELGKWRAEAYTLDYYAHAQFLYARTKLNIYVSIKFPISSISKPFHLYKILSLPVPVNQTSSHSTQLLDLPSYFAISFDSQHYATLETSQLSSCTGRSLLHCPFRFPLQASNNPSCEIALFQDRRSDIKSMCNFRYITQPQPSQLIAVDSSHVLVYQIPFLSLTCPGHRRMVPGCTFCVLGTPCSCTLSTETLYYPAAFGTCHNTSEKLTRLHPVNLALLQHFFDPSTLATIAGDTNFKKAIQIQIPDFHIYSHKSSKILAQDKNTHLSLRRIAERAKNDQTIFQNLAEPLLDGQIAVPSSWPDTNTIIVLISTSISVLSICLVIWMFFKLRTLSAALVLISHAAPVKSALLPNFNYDAYTSTTINPSDLVK
ncbi:uncharacterized protein LOC124282624 [Haliotis rubra]|uniref:uncharacterized protein LOC124282624 n=1 Tax=Haliotis rubra TaxID=36100 RepID=UPI001EE50F85|nr:uncharacterized protein LOC124282624 [Haliotis rubra]